MALSGNPVVLGGPASARAGAGVISPDGISATQVAYGSGANQIKGEAAFVYVEASDRLQIGTTSGTRLLLGTGTDSTNGALQLASHTTSSGGIGFGTDTTLFRNSSGSLYLTSAGTTVLRVSNTSATVNTELTSTGSIGALGTTSNHSFVLFSTNVTALTFDSSQRGSFTGGTDTSSSGTFTPVTIARTYNQTGTAGSIDLLVNRTETALGSGDQMHMEMQVGGVRRWSLGTRRVTTTDATVTTLATIPVPASTTLGVTGYVVARRTGGSAGTAEDGAYYRVETVYKNAAGTATAIGTTVTAIGESQAAWDVTVSQSGGNVLIQVTGAVDNNVTWMGVFHRNPIST